MSNYSVAENFSQYFKIRFADTKELRQEAFKIRYGVYSEELGWEPKNETGMETDEYDDCAFHCLLEHKRTKTFAGCIRLVIPPITNQEFLLPFEKNCMDSVKKDVLDPTTMPRGSFGEISRLAVLASFRRRENEKNQPYIVNDANPETVFTEDERRNFPNIAMGLYLAAVSLATNCQHFGTFVMMEPRLNRRLKRFGLPFLQVGETMDYHGKRAMFYIDRNEFTINLSPELLSLYEVIHQDLCRQMSFIPYTNPADK